MKKSICLFGLASVFALSGLAKEELTVYTYDSFNASWGPGPKIKTSFEKQCDCKLNFVAVDDGASILNRVKLEGKSTKADVLLGLDTNLIEPALKTGLIAKHNQNTSDLALPKKWDNEYFIPYDYGYYAFIYDSNKTKNPPKSMKEFLSDKGSVIYQDPRTSTVGLGLVLWLEKLYGKNSDEVKKAWEKMAKKTVTTTKGWSEAYNMFLKGESDYVLSYTTSPAYHMVAEKKNNYKAISFEEGNYMQTEVVAKLKTSKHQKLADKFMKFVLSKDFQTFIPTGNWMYPVIDVKTPEEFGKLPPVKALELSPQDVAKNRKTWIKTWQKAIVK
ncbi:MAG: thiamine ABC transporter substrate binding subunit [Campylobacteraceae bacterium]|nr:thiamine ABC transporter substrate binding subunit [Campylobacteraceae bacterium]